MAGRGYKKTSNAIDNKKVWNVAGYGRRSFDDNESIESNTITTQKNMINYYINNSTNMKLYDFYMDDGFTGTNFNRPDFKRMIDDIKSNKVNCIIVKDLSRLARNHRLIGEYLEEIFPKYEVRIIAINDTLDSFKDPDAIYNLMVPIKNLLNEGYARDISIKVKSAYLMMAKSGQFVAGTTPYGYMLDSNDKHHLVIDKKEAKIVKLIFQMTIEGNGRIKICKYLNNNCVLCRKELQYRKKHKIDIYDKAIIPKYFWCTTTIGRMLSNETYIGNLVQLKTERGGLGDKNEYQKSPDEWIKCYGTHEAIISEKTFKIVQEIIKDRTYEKREPKNYSIYRNLLKCYDCKSAMLRFKDDRIKNNDSAKYYCMRYKRTSNICSPHMIKETELNDIVKKAIQLQIKLVLNLEKDLTKICLFNNNKEEIERQYKDNTNLADIKIEYNRQLKKENYILWKKGEISKEKFLLESEKLEQNIKNIENQIELYVKTYRENLKKLKKEESWIEHYRRNKSIRNLNSQILKELIEVIYITSEGNVEIVFKYQDQLENLEKYIISERTNLNEKVDSRNLCKIIS